MANAYNNIYMVTGSEDGPLGMFSSYKKAMVEAKKYGGEDAVVDGKPSDRNTDVQSLNNNHYATIEKWYIW